MNRGIKYSAATPHMRYDKARMVDGIHIASYTIKYQFIPTNAREYSFLL
jgi:hypothetical protein